MCLASQLRFSTPCVGVFRSLEVECFRKGCVCAPSFERGGAGSRDCHVTSRRYGTVMGCPIRDQTVT
eukprot:3258091-Rhodomonas_salina.2